MIRPVIQPKPKCYVDHAKCMPVLSNNCMLYDLILHLHVIILVSSACRIRPMLYSNVHMHAVYQPVLLPAIVVQPEVSCVAR